MSRFGFDRVIIYTSSDNLFHKSSNNLFNKTIVCSAIEANRIVKLLEEKGYKVKVYDIIASSPLVAKL